VDIPLGVAHREVVEVLAFRKAAVRPFHHSTIEFAWIFTTRTERVTYSNYFNLDAGPGELAIVWHVVRVFSPKGVRNMLPNC